MDVDGANVNSRVQEITLTPDLLSSCPTLTTQVYGLLSDHPTPVFFYHDLRRRDWRRSRLGYNALTLHFTFTSPLLLSHLIFVNGTTVNSLPVGCRHVTVNEDESLLVQASLKAEEVRVRGCPHG